MVKKQNCLLCQNLDASEAALWFFWKIGESLAICKNLASF